MLGPKYLTSAYSLHCPVVFIGQRAIVVEREKEFELSFLSTQNVAYGQMRDEAPDCHACQAEAYIFINSGILKYMNATKLWNYILQYTLIKSVEEKLIFCGLILF